MQLRQSLQNFFKCLSRSLAAINHGVSRRQTVRFCRAKHLQQTCQLQIAAGLQHNIKAGNEEKRVSIRRSATVQFVCTKKGHRKSARCPWAVNWSERFPQPSRLKNKLDLIVSAAFRTFEIGRRIDENRAAEQHKQKRPQASTFARGAASVRTRHPNGCLLIEATSPGNIRVSLKPVQLCRCGFSGRSRENICM